MDLLSTCLKILIRFIYLLLDQDNYKNKHRQEKLTHYGELENFKTKNLYQNERLKEGLESLDR